MKKSRGSDKKGQVTIFIIVSILLVLAVLIFFIWVKPTFIKDSGRRTGFEGCVQDVMEGSIEELALNAGYISPEFTYTYQDEEIPYLCYTSEYYSTCTVQVPFLKQHFQENLENKIRSEINDCYLESLESLRSQGYEVSEGSIDYNLSFEPGVVRADIDAPLTVGSNRFQNFEVTLQSSVYDLVMKATTILQYEAGLGDADTSKIMEYYPEYKIVKLKRDDGTTIYTIENKEDGIKMRFASRSLAWPAGYK